MEIKFNLEDYIDTDVIDQMVKDEVRLLIRKKIKEEGAEIKERIDEALCWPIEDCTNEALPKIRQKVDEIIEDKLDAEFLLNAVSEQFYERLRQQLF